MVKFKIPIRNILGLSFYRYELTSSTYNPQINTAFTITCKCTDIFGNPISGKQLTLYKDGTAQTTQTTNNNGEATWNITGTTGGVNDFKVANQHCYINLTNWKTVSVTGATSYATLYVNESLRLCELEYVRDFGSADADKFYSWHSGAIPSTYRPSAQVNGSMNQVGTLYVDSTGEIGGKFANAWSSNRTVKGTVTWHY